MGLFSGFSGKGRGVVITDKSKYTEKGLTILSKTKIEPYKINRGKSSTHGKKN